MTAECKTSSSAARTKMEATPNSDSSLKRLPAANGCATWSRTACCLTGTKKRRNAGWKTLERVLTFPKLQQLAATSVKELKTLVTFTNCHPDNTTYSSSENKLFIYTRLSLLQASALDESVVLIFQSLIDNHNDIDKDLTTVTDFQIHKTASEINGKEIIQRCKRVLLFRFLWGLRLWRVRVMF